MHQAGRCVRQVCWVRQLCMLRNVEVERAILVLLLPDDDLLD